MTHRRRFTYTWNLVFITVVAMCLFLARGVTVPIYPLYARALGADYRAIGLLGMVAPLTLLLFNYVWGRAADRWGRRKPILTVGLLILALGYALTAMIPGYRFLFPLAALAAVGQAAYDTAGLALLGDLLERRMRRGRRIGLYRGLGSLSFGSSALFAGVLSEAYGQRTSFMISAAGFLVAFGLALLLRERAVAPSSSESVSPTAGVAPPSPQQVRLPLTPLLIAAFLWSAVFAGVFAVWPNYMVEDVGYNSSTMSRLWALAALSELPWMIFAGWLSDHLGRLPVLGLSFLAWALVFVGYVGLPQLPWLVLIQVLRGFAFSAFTATAMAYTTEVRGRAQRGRMAGLYGTISALGAIAGAPLGGGVAQAAGFRVMIGGGAAIIFAGALYLFATHVWLKKRQRVYL